MPRPPPSSYADAETAFQRGSTRRRPSLFAGYTRGHPENPWGHYMYGLSAWKSGDHEQALSGLRRGAAARSAITGRACSTPRACCSRPASRRRPWTGSSARCPSSRSRAKALRLLGRARYELKPDPRGDRRLPARPRAGRARRLGDEQPGPHLHPAGPERRGAAGPLARAVELTARARRSSRTTSARRWSAPATPPRRTHAYESALEVDSTYGKASASLTRLGGPVEDPVADSAQTVDLAVFVAAVPGADRAVAGRYWHGFGGDGPRWYVEYGRAGDQSRKGS